jgi:RimJ/RimL family protein N-acetyltransferase
LQLESDRLVLRLPREPDADVLAALYADPAVMRYSVPDVSHKKHKRHKRILYRCYGIPAGIQCFVICARGGVADAPDPGLPSGTAPRSIVPLI